MRLLAWVSSTALHVLILGGLLVMLRPLERQAPPDPERLVYVEPAPPPPPAATGGGIGDGEDTAARPEEPASAALQPAQPAASPVVVATSRPHPKPTSRPARSKPSAAPLTPAAAAIAGETGGDAQGVADGTIGGQLGGTVGGRGDAPIVAELAASPPVVTARVLPEYPSAARAQRIEGQVLLRAVVDHGGHVEDSVTVMRSIPQLDDAAVAALRQWHFSPGRDHDGRTVRVQIEVPMRFQLR